MISYGLRYIRYNSELLFNNSSYNLYYDEIITYDSSKNFKNEYIIEFNKSCTEYIDDDEINKDPCEIIFLDKEDVSLHFSINNYMGKVVYKINEDDWKTCKTDISDFTIKSEYIGLFKQDYIDVDYHIGFNNKKLVIGENKISIKYREKEDTFIFKYDEKIKESNKNKEDNNE